MIRDYILTVTAASLICGIVNAIQFRKTPARALIKLISGLFLAVTVISPLLQLKIRDYIDYSLEVSMEADAIAAEGENIAAEAMGSIIKSKTDAYILDKAASLGADVQIETVLADTQPLVPVRVVIKGTASPYAKTLLSDWISQTIGIPKEAQQWIG